MSEYVDFESEIPSDKIELLFKLGQEFSFDPSSSIESEKYFVDLFLNYKDNSKDLIDFLRENIKNDFRVVDKKPIWIQDPEWQFANGRPMEFVGQMEIKKNKINMHDDVTFYTFWDRGTGEIKTIMQIY